MLSSLHSPCAPRLSSAPQRAAVAKVAPKMAPGSARRPGMGGADEERAELMHEVSMPATDFCRDQTERNPSLMLNQNQNSK